MNYSNFTYERLLAELCIEHGYKPILEQRDAQAEPVVAASMAIVAPSSVVDIEGRGRGRLKSVVGFTLVKNAAGATSAARSVILNQIKCDAVNVLFALRQIASVVDVSDIRFTPVKRDKQNYNEVLVKVSATVVSTLDIEGETAQLI